MKHLLFDVDGVLCTGGFFTKALERKHGIPPSALAPFFAGPFRDCVVGKRDLREALDPLLPGIGWNQSVDAFLAFWFHEENVVDQAVLQRVRDLRARGHRCYVATNQERHRLEYLRDVMGFRALLDGDFCSCELGVAKPDPNFFLTVQRRLDCSPEEIWFLDDTLASVETARSLGWNAHHHPADSAAGVFAELSSPNTPLGGRSSV